MSNTESRETVNARNLVLRLEKKIRIATQALEYNQRFGKHTALYECELVALKAQLEVANKRFAKALGIAL